MVRTCVWVGSCIAMIGMWSSSCVAERKVIEAKDVVCADPAKEVFELRMDGKSDQAKALMEKACKRTPKDARLWFEVARVRWHQWSRKRDMTPAKHAIDKAVKLDPDNGRYLYYAGQIHFYHGFIKAQHLLTILSLPVEMGKAKKLLERTLTLDPNDHRARLFLLKLYECPAPLGSKRKAAKHRAKLEMLDPILHAIHVKDPQIDSQDHQAKLALWIPLLQSHPDRPEVRARLCKLYAGMKDYAKAIEHFERARHLDSWQQRLLLDIARSCGKDQTQRERYEDQYLAGTPTPPKAMQSLVWGQRYWRWKRQDKPEEAEKALARVNELDPDGHAGPELIRDMFVEP